MVCQQEQDRQAPFLVEMTVHGGSRKTHKETNNSTEGIFASRRML